MFTTSCFVWVPDDANRADLCAWLNKIGYVEVIPSFSRRVNAFYVWCNPPSFNTTTQSYVKTPRKYIPKGVYDCGSNVELFKALAAMNDSHDQFQWFVNDFGAWFKCDVWVAAKTFSSHDEYGRLHVARKATAEEIIEHFKK